MNSLTSYPYYGVNIDIKTKTEKLSPEELAYEDQKKTTTKSIKFPVVNQDFNIGGKLDVVKSKLKSKRGTQEGNKYLNRLKYDSSNLLQDRLERNDQETNEMVAEQLSAVLDIKIYPEEIQGLVEHLGGVKSFANKIQSHTYESIYSVLKGSFEVKDINSILTNILQYVEQNNQLKNNFLNKSGNSQSTTQYGQYIVRELARLSAKRTNPDTGKKEFKTTKLAEYQKNKFFKNNPLIEKGKNWIGKGKLKYGKLDALSNFATNSVTEYNRMSPQDYILTQFFMYAVNNSDKSYNQTFGIKSNRDSMSLFSVPKYTKAELKQHYDNQAEMLNEIYQEMIKEGHDKAKMKKAVESMYLHKVVGDKVVSGFMNSSHQAEIDKISQYLKDLDYKDFI